MQALLISRDSGETVKQLRDVALNASITGGVEIVKITGVCDNINNLAQGVHATIKSNITTVYKAYNLYLQNVDINENGTLTVSLATITNLMSDYNDSSIDKKFTATIPQLITRFLQNNNYACEVINENNALPFGTVYTNEDLLTIVKEKTENTAVNLISTDKGLVFTTASLTREIPSPKTVNVREVITFDLPVNRHIVSYPKDQPVGEEIGTIGELGRTTTATAETRQDAQAQIARWKNENNPIPAIQAEIFEYEIGINDTISVIDTSTHTTYLRRVKEIVNNGELFSITTYRKEN